MSRDVGFQFHFSENLQIEPGTRSETTETRERGLFWSSVLHGFHAVDVRYEL